MNKTLRRAACIPISAYDFERCALYDPTMTDAAQPTAPAEAPRRYPELPELATPKPGRWRVPENEASYIKQASRLPADRARYTTRAIVLVDRLGINATTVLERDFDAHHYRDGALGLSYLELVDKKRYAARGYTPAEKVLIDETGVAMGHDGITGPLSLPRFVEYEEPLKTIFRESAKPLEDD